MKWLGQYIQNFKATFRQDVTLDSTLTFDSVALTGVQTSAESFVDDDVSIMTSAAIDDRISAAVTAEDLDVSADSGTAAVDLDSESLRVAGGTNVTTSAAGQSVTVNLDNPIAGPLEIEQGASGGGVALLIDNDDIDQFALQVDAANTTAAAIAVRAVDLTTANAISVNCDSLTTGTGLKLDIDDALTTGATKSLSVIDYDKAGITGDGATHITTGLDINMADAATNHANGRVTMIGAQIDVDSANVQGTITQRGLIVNVAADDVGDAVSTSGIETTVMDGGADIKMKSSADAEDYCTIVTETAGRTTITTVDSAAATANFEIEADGDITLDANGQIKLEPVAGNNILLDGTVTVDAGVVNGITAMDGPAASATASGIVELATTAEADTGTDTARAITAAGLESHVSARYHYQYVHFIGNSDIATNWGIPTDNGANAHSWSVDTGVSGTTVGSTTYTAARGKSTIGFTVPLDGVLVGFYGTGRNHNNSNNIALGLFIGPPNWGATGTTDYTLRAYAAGSYSGGTGTSYKGALKVIDLARSHTLTAGDIIIPAVLETTADKVFCNMTVVIKTLIPT